MNCKNNLFKVLKLSFVKGVNFNPIRDIRILIISYSFNILG